MLRRNILKKKEQLSEKDEEEINTLEEIIAQECEDENRKKVKENFNELGGNDGNVNHQGIWKAKRKCFPKIKPTIPVGKKNLKDQIITNPEELKELYLETFKFRLRQRPVKPGYEVILDKQEQLFNSLDFKRFICSSEITKKWKIQRSRRSYKRDLQGGGYGR